MHCTKYVFVEQQANSHNFLQKSQHFQKITAHGKIHRIHGFLEFVNNNHSSWLDVLVLMPSHWLVFYCDICKVSLKYFLFTAH